MGKEDIGLKSYLASMTRYADLWNGAVFGGRQLIKAEELEEINSVLDQADERNVLERSRDMVMCQCCNGQRLAVWVVENQKTVDYSMPVRIMLQEALEYNKQIKTLNRKNKALEKLQKECDGSSIYADAGEKLYGIRMSDKLYPVITLVLYWGDEGWKGPRSLHEMVMFENLSEDERSILRQLVPEYPLHILDLSSLEHTENFLTELRHLFELYKRRNDKEEFRKYISENEQSWNMNDETWFVLSSLTHSKKMRNLAKRKEEEKTEMCKALDDLVDDAIAEGVVKGRAEGRAEMLIDILGEYGEVEATLQEEIRAQRDSVIIKRWVILAAQVKSIEEFVLKMHE